MSLWRNLAFTVLLAAIAAAVGVVAGESYVSARAHAPPNLHRMLHQKLRLTPEQVRVLASLERDHTASQERLESQMRSADATLAAAYAADHAMTPKVRAAIEQLHRIMGASQEETIAHIVAMRSVLRPDQTGTFDAVVVRSLTAPGG